MFHLSNAKICKRRCACAKKWQNNNRIWDLQMRKCQRLVEWNLLGHPTVTSGKRQEVSSLGRSHSSWNNFLGYYIPFTNNPIISLLMSDPSHPTCNLADTSPFGSVLIPCVHDSKSNSRKPNCFSSTNSPASTRSCQAEWRLVSSARSSRVCDVPTVKSDLTLHEHGS